MYFMMLPMILVIKDCQKTKVQPVSVHPSYLGTVAD